MEVVDERTLEKEEKRYFTSAFIVKILGNKFIPNQNGHVTNGLAADQVRIVLRWGEKPRDLDSHLVGPTSSGSTFHIYYRKKRHIESSLMADLDLDDTTSYGPETTTIYQAIPGEYVFMVHDYTNRMETSSSKMANSGAYVEVYLGKSSVAAYTFYVPNFDGTVWTVFKYNSETGVITLINKMSYQSAPENVGLNYRDDTDIIILKREKKDYEKDSDE